MERKMMTELVTDPDFSFFWSSHPYHAYYQKKLGEYRALKHDGALLDHIKINGSDYGLGAYSSSRVRVPRKLPPIPPPPMRLTPRVELLPPRMRRPPLPPRKYVIILPQGITAKDLENIKATAKSVVQHGMVYVLSLNMDDPQFDFMKQGDWRYLYFNKLVSAYLADSLDKSELVASESDTAAFEESFQRFFEEKKMLHEGAELAVADLHEMVLMLLLVPPKSEPKKQRCF